MIQFSKGITEAEAHTVLSHVSQAIAMRSVSPGLMASAESLKYADSLQDKQWSSLLSEYLENSYAVEANAPRSPCSVLHIGSQKCTVYHFSESAELSNFRRILSSPDPDLLYQIIIKPIRAESDYKTLPMHHEEARALSLATGISPAFWTASLPGNAFATSSLAEPIQFIPIGRAFLVMPKTYGDSRAKTAILLARPISDFTSPFPLVLSGLSTTLTTSTASMPPLYTSREAKVTEKLGEAPMGVLKETIQLPPQHGELEKLLQYLGKEQAVCPSDALEQWILEKTQDLECYGQGNFLFACLEALLRLHSTEIRFGAYTADLKKYLTGLYSVIHAQNSEDVRRRWRKISQIIIICRGTLLLLPGFISENFNMEDRKLARVSSNIMAQYETHTKGLELAELKLQDSINMIRSGLATERAYISIQESKRVMLLTALAFVFLPLSLAGTIFGMNVQQINQSGHDIVVFIITSIAMILLTLLLWATSARLTAARRALIQHRIEANKHWWDKWSWKEQLLFVDGARHLEHMLFVRVPRFVEQIWNRISRPLIDR